MAGGDNNNNDANIFGDDSVDNDCEYDDCMVVTMLMISTVLTLLMMMTINMIMITMKTIMLMISAIMTMMMIKTSNVICSVYLVANVVVCKIFEQS